MDGVAMPARGRRVSPGSGSRADRLSHPLSSQALREVAAKNGVCIHPVSIRRTDLATGRTDVIDVRCGATREAKCPACAQRAKRLREEQCRQGWHRDDEPEPPPKPDDDQVGLVLLRGSYEYARADCVARGDWAQVADLDEGIAEVEAMMLAAGLRGKVTKKPDKTKAIAAALAALPDPTDVTPLVDADPSADPADRVRGTDPADPRVSTVDADGLVAGGGDAIGAALRELPGSDGGGGRRVRSTRRRQDTPNLPRLKVIARTVGRTFTAPNGTVFRPSTFVTITLPSYGRVRPDGSPVDPGSYDYRRAAWDAVHFPALLDRFWQNLRRAVGWNVQYFGAVEPQRRLAPHAHFAVRGAIPRATIRQVIDATYHQVRWPSTAVVRYPDHGAQPVWDDDAGTFRDPDTGGALPTWDQALDQLDDALDADPQRGPEHVVRFGAQANLQGVLAGTARSRKCVRYLVKYVTKSVAECHPPTTDTAAEHQRRLWEEMRYTPCSSRCPNWLRYGIQPENARAKMVPGYCRGKTHQLDTLGMGGRRILVSRQWSGKTLADHRHDQHTWYRNLIAVTPGLDDDIDEELAARILAARDGGAPAPVAWELARPGDPDVLDLDRRLYAALEARRRRLDAIAAARETPPGQVSATSGDP